MNFILCVFITAKNKKYFLLVKKREERIWVATYIILLDVFVKVTILNGLAFDKSGNSLRKLNWLAQGTKA